MIITVKTDVATEPVLAADMRAWLSLDSTSQDTLLTSLAKAARMKIEKLTGLAFGERTITYVCETDMASIQLPYNPVTSIVSVKAIAGDGTSDTLDSGSYSLVNNIAFVNGTGVYEIEYKAGKTITEQEKQLIMKQAAYDYLNRGDGSANTYAPEVYREVQLITINNGY